MVLLSACAEWRRLLLVMVLECLAAMVSVCFLLMWLSVLLLQGLLLELMISLTVLRIVGVFLG